MPFCTLNDMAVSEAIIDIPRIGVWHADMHINSFQSFTGKAIIQFGSQTFNGVFGRNGPEINKKLRARVIGGAGSLSKVLKPKGYRAVPIKIPLNDALIECGERLSDRCDTLLITVELESWTRLQMMASQAIDMLLQFAPTPNPSWRVLADGSVWVGYEHWGESETTDAIPLYEEPERGTLAVYSDDPIILPGQTLNYHVPGVGTISKKVSHVRHVLRPRFLRSTIFYEDEE